MDSDNDNNDDHYDPSDNNYGYGDVVADTNVPDTGDYDYEWSTGHTACGDYDN